MLKVVVQLDFTKETIITIYGHRQKEVFTRLRARG